MKTDNLALLSAIYHMVKGFVGGDASSSGWVVLLMAAVTAADKDSRINTSNPKRGVGIDVMFNDSPDGGISYAVCVYLDSADFYLFHCMATPVSEDKHSYEVNSLYAEVIHSTIICDDAPEIDGLYTNHFIRLFNDVKSHLSSDEYINLEKVIGLASGRYTESGDRYGSVTVMGDSSQQPMWVSVAGGDNSDVEDIYVAVYTSNTAVIIRHSIYSDTSKTNYRRFDI